MVIVGIGNDLIAISRIYKTYERFGTRFLSRWAVKESVYKAFGNEDRKKLNFTNIKLFHSPKGKPEIELVGSTLELAQALGITAIHVAITHDNDYALANVILEK